MAIRNSKEENYQINGNLNEVIERCRKALINGNFIHIDFNSVINQFTADYHKFTVWGKIKVTLTEAGNNGSDKINVSVASTGNVDNIYALFTSPNDKILSQFKDNL
jgi:hypothetical protein